MHPELESLPVVLLRLIVSLLIGALLGFEREQQQRPAGLRTHMLVTLGATLFSMVSILAAGEDHDRGRIAAQVVTGIGFLGAGTIMRHGSTVKGLTTAASLWTAAALGVAIGFGWYVAGIVAAILAFVVLAFVKHFEDLISRDKAPLKLAITAAPGKDPLPRIIETARLLGAEPGKVTFGPETMSEGLHFIIGFSLPESLPAATVAGTIQGLDGVRDVEPGRP